MHIKLSNFIYLTLINNLHFIFLTTLIKDFSNYKKRQRRYYFFTFFFFVNGIFYFLENIFGAEKSLMY